MVVERRSDLPIYSRRGDDEETPRLDGGLFNPSLKVKEGGVVDLHFVGKGVKTENNKQMGP